MADFAGALLPVLGLAALAGASDLLGGWLALRREHFDDPRYIIAFSAGIVIAAVFFELLPASVAGLQGNALQNQMLVTGFGFFAFYLVEKSIMLRACGQPECTTHHYSPTMVAGMAADNVVDGVGIAVAFLLDPLVGFAVTAMVVAHEIPQGLASAELLKHAGWPRGRIVLVLCAAGGAYVAGAALAGLFSPGLYQAALGFVTGTFVYIGCADLLTEAHQKFNNKVIAAVILGAALMLALTLLEARLAVA